MKKQEQKTHKQALAWKPCLAMVLASLFLQTLHWVGYTFFNLSAGWLVLTPLLLCGVYHVYQSDTAENRGSSRKAVFFWSILVPFLVCVLLSLGMYLSHPDLTVYHNVEPETGIAETIALYSGRDILTGLYLLVFSAIDIPLLHLSDRHRDRKAEQK